jgi:DNA-binding XRE family transcriptional regulator
LVAVSPTTMYNILKGKSDPRCKTVRAIANITHIKSDILFERAEK